MPRRLASKYVPPVLLVTVTGPPATPAAALTAHRDRGLHRRVVSCLVGRTRGATAAAAATDALGIDCVGLRPVGRDRSGVGCVRRTAIAGRAAAASDRNRNVDVCAVADIRLPGLGLREDPVQLVVRRVDFLADLSNLENAIAKIRDLLTEVQAARQYVEQGFCVRHGIGPARCRTALAGLAAAAADALD